jgi:hypothetical protein
LVGEIFRKRNVFLDSNNLSGHYEKSSPNFFMVLLVVLQSRVSAQTPYKLRRADCFFGVHFDHHASKNISDAGKTLTAEMVI